MLIDLRTSQGHIFSAVKDQVLSRWTNPDSCVELKPYYTAQLSGWMPVMGDQSGYTMFEAMPEVLKIFKAEFGNENQDVDVLKWLGKQTKPCTQWLQWIQRRALFLSGYSYELKYQQRPSNGNADGLRKLPVPTAVVNIPNPGDMMFAMDHFEFIIHS